MDSRNIRVGDDITISGTVEEVRQHILLIATTGRDGVVRRHWIDPTEIKTRRPGGKGGK